MERTIAGQGPSDAGVVRGDHAKARLDALKLWLDEQLELIPRHERRRRCHSLRPLAIGALTRNTKAGSIRGAADTLRRSGGQVDGLSVLRTYERRGARWLGGLWFFRQGLRGVGRCCSDAGRRR